MPLHGCLQPGTATTCPSDPRVKFLQAPVTCTATNSDLSHTIRFLYAFPLCLGLGSGKGMFPGAMGPPGWLWECPSRGCCLSLPPCRRDNRDCLIPLGAQGTRVMQKQRIVNLAACWGWEGPELCAFAVGRARWWQWEVPAEAGKGHRSRDGGDLGKLSRGTRKLAGVAPEGMGKADRE